MTELCPVCSHPVAPGDTVCATCGFKLLGATQAFKPLSVEGDSVLACENTPTRAALNVVRGPKVGMVYGLGSEPITVGRSPSAPSS